MTHEHRKFLLELENYFNNFPEYTIGEVLYSLMRSAGKKEDFLNMSNQQLTEKLEESQFIETETEYFNREEITE